MTHNRFDVTEILGSGGEGQVFKARDRARGGALVAVKDLTASHNAEIARIRQEFRLLAGLSHPHLARLLEYGAGDVDGAFLLYEYVPGTPVHRTRDRSPSAMVDLLAQALRALAFLHSKRIAHGDISPDNMQVTPDGRLKLIDFGLCAPLGEDQPGGGTPPYLAPERLEGGPVTGAVDLFALGATAYRVLAACEPFAIETGGRIAYDERTPLIERVPTLEPDFAAWVEGLLALDPSDRPGSAREALAGLARATGRELPLETGPTLRAYLDSTAAVGNAPQLGELRRAFTDLVDPNERGTAGVALLSGDRGVGKTRALHDFRLWVSAAGARTLSAAGYAAHEAPYSTLLELVAHASERGWVHDPALPEALDAYIDELGPGDDAGGREHAEARASRIHETAAVLLMQLAEEDPLVVTVDDLHRADAGSLAFFTYLVRNLSLHQREVSDVAPPLMFVGTAQLDETPSPALASLVHEIGEAHGRRLVLEPLTSEETAQLLTDALGGRAPDDADAAWIHGVTQGNPLFFRELLITLRPRMQPRPDGSGIDLVLTAEDRERMPSSRIGLMRARLDEVAPPLRELLTTLSLFSSPARTDVIAAAAGLSTTEVDDRLRELADSHWVARCGGDPIRWTVRDAAARTVSREHLDDATRRALHARAADALLACPAANEADDLPELAHHFLVTDPAHRGHAYAEKAARRAVRIHAFPVAVELFRAALDAIGPGTESDRRRVESALAETYIITGRGHEAIEVLETAAARSPESATAGLWADLGAAHASVGESREACDCYRRSLSASRHAPLGTRLPLLLRRAEAGAGLGRYTASIRLGRRALAWEDQEGDDAPVNAATRILFHRVLSRLSFLRGDLREAERHATRWLVGVGDAPLDQAAALNQLGNIHLRAGRPGKALANYERALDLREQHGDLKGQASTLNNLGILDRRRGAQASAGDYFRRAVKIQAKLGDAFGQAVSLNNLANVHQEDGRLDRAIHAYESSLALFEREGNVHWVAVLHANLGNIAAMGGDYRSALDHHLTCLTIRRKLQSPGRVTDALLAIATVLVEMGDHDRGARLLERVVCRAREQGEDLLGAYATFQRARIDAARGEFARAADAFRAAVDAAGKHGVASLQADAILELARLGLHRGDLPETTRRLEEGLATLGQGAAYQRTTAEYALTRVDLAMRLRSRPRAALAKELEALQESTENLGFRPLCLDIMATLGRLRERMNDSAAALDLYQRAIDVIEAIAGSIPSPRLSTAFLHSRRVRRIEHAVSAFRHRLYLRSPDATVRDETGLAGLKSDLYDVERSLDFTKSRFDKQNAGLKRILEIARVLSTKLRTEGLFELMLDSIMELTEAERGFVLIRNDAGGGRFDVAAARDREKHDVERPEREISYSVVSRVLADGRPMLLRDAAGDDIMDHTHSVVQLDLRSIMCVPLTAGPETIGVLYVENRSRADRFAEDDLELLSIFAHQAAVALTNAGLFRDLEHSLENLRHAQEKLIRQEKLRLMGEMASGVLHNLKNLLTPVLGHTQLMLMDPNNEAQAEDLRAVERLTLDCREVIKRFSNFSRGGDAPLELEQIDLHEFVEEVGAITRTRWDRPREETGAAIRLLNDVPHNLSAPASPAQLREIFINLIYNAVDAMPDGGEIRVEGCGDDDTVCVSVLDTGVGMTEDVKRKMFEPFFSTKDQRGMGVGMSVTELIVQQHRGRIEVDSAPGRGTRISVFLPRHAPAAPDHAPDQEEAAPVDPTPEASTAEKPTRAPSSVPTKRP